MRTAIRVAAAAAVAGAAVAAAASPAFASASSPAGTSRAGHAVFVQTDNTAGNRVVAYDRAADGTLAPAGSYATGGRGGILAGSVVDPFGHLVIAEAGTNAVSTFQLSRGTASLLHRTPATWRDRFPGRPAVVSRRTWPAARTAPSTWPRCARRSAWPADWSPRI